MSVGWHLRVVPVVAMLIATMLTGRPATASPARGRADAPSFHCPFTAQRLTALTEHLTGFRLVLFENQNDGLHGTCIFVDPEPSVHSLLAGDRKVSISFVMGLQTVAHEQASWHATPGWTVTARPEVARGAFEARLKARSAASTNQLMLSFPAASGGSWGITIATRTNMRLAPKLLDSVLVTLHTSILRW